MVKLISFPVMVGIICVGSLTANATATGSLLLSQWGWIGEISERAPILVGETLFFLTMALIILVKLIDYIIRRRYSKENGVDQVVKPTETSQGRPSKSNERDENARTGQ